MRLTKSIAFVLILTVYTNSFAASCKLLESLAAFNLPARFWADVGSLVDKSNRRILQLAEQYKPGISRSNLLPYDDLKANVSGVPTRPPSSGNMKWSIEPNLNLSSRSKKAIKTLRGTKLKGKVDEFLEIANRDDAIDILTSRRSWNYEPLNQLFDGQKAYSVRLNQANRVVFTVENGRVHKIIDAGSRVYAH